MEEFQFDLFIAYHGTNDPKGSCHRAEELYEFLTQKGIKCYFHPRASSLDYDRTPIMASKSANFLLVCNKNIETDEGGVISSYDLNQELKGFTNLIRRRSRKTDNIRAYTFGGLTAEMANDLSPHLLTLDHVDENICDKSVCFRKVYKWIYSSKPYYELYETDRSIDGDNANIPTVGTKIVNEDLSSPFKKEIINKDAPKSIAKDKQIKLTVKSPVNIDVYLNDNDWCVMNINRYHEPDNKSIMIDVAGKFDLIFVAEGFGKVRSFDAESIDGDNLEFNLHEMLSEEEILASYDRLKAVNELYTLISINREADVFKCTYALEQLSKIGLKPDASYLKWKLRNLYNGDVFVRKSFLDLYTLFVSAIGKIEYNPSYMERFNDLKGRLPMSAEKFFSGVFGSYTGTYFDYVGYYTGVQSFSKRTSRDKHNKMKTRFPQYERLTYAGTDGSRSFDIYEAFDPKKGLDIEIREMRPTNSYIYSEMKRLSADNVVKIVDRRLNRPECLIVEKVSGITLDEYLRHSLPLNDFKRNEKVINIMLGVLNGLKALHDKNIFYRSSSIKGIIIDENGTPWLSDFSKLYTEDMFNRWGYESESGYEKCISLDVRAFGLLLQDVLKQDVFNYLTLNFNVSERCRWIAEKATKKLQEERFKNMSEITELLEDVLRHIKA